MKLEDLGYHADLEEFRLNQKLDSFGVGRVISEHKERYVVKNTEGEYDAEVIGSLRFSAQSRSDFPAVGDWVAISEYDESRVLIHSVFPRKTVIERQAVGRQGEKQIIASNIDYAFIVQAVDRDFSINRIERYLTICYASDVKPIIILNKIDLIDDSDLSNLITTIQERVKEVQVIPISNETGAGIDKLKESILKGLTYCLLGSSGVGKSTLVNNLSGKQLMKTNTISSSTSKGRHITSHRELLILDNGGILIDNPGMREVGIADSAGGLDITFEAIVQVARDCRYQDCTHRNETGCAVIAAVDRGDIDQSSYENYLRMERETAYFESTVAERRQKDKDLGKLIKHFKNTKDR